MQHRQHWDRRTVLKIGSLGAAGAALTSTFGKAARASSSGSSGKLLVINLRGGWDGLHVVHPNGTKANGTVADPDYNSTYRSTLHIASGAQIETGNNFCSMHPELAAAQNGGLKDVLDQDRAVLLCAVGLWSRTGSHFEDQRTVETGLPPDVSTPAGIDREDGWLTRALGSEFEGVSVSSGLQQLFQTRNPADVLPHVRSILAGDNATLAYTLNSTKPVLDSTYRGIAPTPPNDPFGYGLEAHYLSSGQTGNSIEALNRAVGRSQLKSEQAISTMFATTGIYTPSGGADYPMDEASLAAAGLPTFPQYRAFFRNLRDAAWLLKNSDAQVVGIELGGWDTHGGQGALTGSMPDRLRVLSYALRSIDLDLGSQDVTTLCVSEFGRTGKENGAKGTDHGAGSVVVATGPRVVGNANSIVNGNPSRVYGCDENTWPGALSANPSDLNVDGSTPLVGDGEFVAPRQNTLAVFAEVMECVLGVDPAIVPSILPGYNPGLHSKAMFLQ